MKLHTALTIAGTDPSGGAGIMADLKSFQSRHVYGMAVVTSVVAQNTTGVHHVEHLSLESIDRQLHDVYSDIAPQAVKTGMIALPEMMDLIYPYVSKPIPYVMDPVMIATSGDRLVSDEAVNFLKSKLIPTATVITPNRSEAEILADMSITCESDITTAANRILQDLGPQVVIIKGGHIGEDATDYAFTKDGSIRTWTSPKYDTVHTHGTGCTFSAVITAELAKGRDVMDPVMIATSGDRLVSDEAVNFLKSKLIPTATVITPNRSEAEVLADMSINCESDITTAANRILQDLGPQVVIIKGGHIGEDATDYAFTKDGSVRTWTSPKYDTVHTHGTGCTFSAVITAELAKGRDVMDAIGIAKDYIALAIKHNPGLGNGCGPVNHMAYGLLSNGPETMDELLKNDERR